MENTEISKLTDGVYVDSVNGVPGTDYPIGTPGMPVSNLTNALAIAAARKVPSIYIADPEEVGYTLLADIPYGQGKHFYGVQGLYTGVYLDLGGFKTGYSQFTNMVISGIGVVDDIIELDNCQIGTITLCRLLAKHSQFRAIIAPCSLQFDHCLAWDNSPLVLDGSNQAGQQFIFNNQSGELKITNVTAPLGSGFANVTVRGNKLSLTVNASCTGGTINVYGNTKIINNSGGTVVNDYTDKPKAEVAVDTTATNAAETEIFNLSIAGFHYTVDKLRLKCADPGVNTVTVKLYELVDGASTEVDSFAITTANYATYFSLMESGINHLSGDNLIVTVRASAGGPYIVTGSYSYRSA